MPYDLFLFDADDTLFDFAASEKVALTSTFQQLGLKDLSDEIRESYRSETAQLWAQLEQGKISKDFLKVERFKKTFAKHGLDLDAEKASAHYLEFLSEAVFLVDHALEICQFLHGRGEIGIITNGVESVQKRRLKNSALQPYVNFIAVSEECGFAKPDIRFFEYSAKLAKKFSKESALVIGDRMEADVQGAINFGLASCLFNPKKTKFSLGFAPTYEIEHLSGLREIVVG